MEKEFDGTAAEDHNKDQEAYDRTEDQREMEK